MWPVPEEPRSHDDPEEILSRNHDRKNENPIRDTTRRKESFAEELVQENPSGMDEESTATSSSGSPVVENSSDQLQTSNKPIIVVL